ncbi:MAG: hypothetical protein ACKOZM_09035, partial [Flavobacteriales bacterium]
MKVGKWRIWIALSALIIAAVTFWSLPFFETSTAGLSLEARRELWRKAKPDLTALRNGDIIFRHGRGMVSNTLLSLSQTDKRYSHAGVIAIEEGVVFVYHCIGG